MIRLLAIDIDGTLFNSRQEISLANRTALKKARMAGMTPVLVTGRGRLDTESVLDLLGEDLSYICSAGSLIRPGRTGQPIAARTFQVSGELRVVFDFIRRNGAGLLAESLDRYWWFATPEVESVLDPKTLAYVTERCTRSYNPETDLTGPLLKVTVVLDPSLMPAFEKLMTESCPSLHKTHAGHHYMDITAAGVNKGSALELLAHNLNLQHSEIAAIGDQQIDIPMLRYAGVSAAMGNATDSVKAVAGLTAPSHDEDGVAWFVDYLLTQ